MKRINIIKAEEARFTWLYNGQVHPDRELNAPLLDRNGIVTLPTLGSIVPGWTLTFPAKPSLSLARISSVEREAVLAQADNAAQKLSKLGLRVFHFEHGPAVENSVMGCGLDLAHLHTVALDFDLVAAAKSELGDLNWELRGVDSAWNRQDEYLTVWESGDSQISTANVNNPVSQAFRRIIANKMNVPTRWDYRNDAFRANIDATRQLFCD